MFVRLFAGFAQVAAGVAAGAWGYQRWHRPPPNFSGENAEAFVHGASSYLVFLVATPYGWLALWLFLEGLLRVLAAGMEEPLGTAPWTLGRFVVARLRPQRQLPPDLVARSGETIVIDSAHDYDWHALSTVEVDGACYTVAHDAGTPERPHRYRLTPMGEAHVVRTVQRYPAATSAPAGSARTPRPPRRWGRR
jgi:hypothetical protein